MLWEVVRAAVRVFAQKKQRRRYGPAFLGGDLFPASAILCAVLEGAIALLFDPLFGIGQSDGIRIKGGRAAEGVDGADGAGSPADKVRRDREQVPVGGTVEEGGGGGSAGEGQQGEKPPYHIQLPYIRRGALLTIGTGLDGGMKKCARLEQVQY